MVIQSGESQSSSDHQRIKITPAVLRSCCWQAIVILNQFWAQRSLLSMDWCLCQSRVLLTTAILILSPLGPHGQNIGNAQITKEKREKYKKWIMLIIMIVVIRASPCTTRDYWGPPGAEKWGVAEGSVPPALDECQATARVLCQWKKGQTYGEI